MRGQKDRGHGRSKVNVHKDWNANDNLPTYRGVRSIAPYEATTAIEMSWQIDMASACIVLQPQNIWEEKVYTGYTLVY